MGTQPVRPGKLRLALSERSVIALLWAVALLFVLGAAITLGFTERPVTLKSWHLVTVVGVWILAWGGSYGLLNARLRRFDRFLLPLVALLTGWGLVLQARLAPALVTKQALWLLIGCGLMSAVAMTPTLPRILRRYRYTLLTAGLILLGATLIFGVNPSGYGQRLWLGAFGVYLQPSEPLKLLLVIYLAAYLSDKRDLPEVKATGQSMWGIVLGPVAAMVGVALLLLGWQQDLGAALLFYITFVMMIYLAWGKAWYALLSLILFVPVGIAGYLFSDRVALRISIWLDPWGPDQADRAFQILQSLYALGAGGMLGQGLGQGFPGLIPAVHTDFVYSALVEEFGLVGGIAFLVLIGLFAYRGLRLAARAESAFESLLAGGIAAMVAVQTWVIVGGNARLIPITGVTLPFFSYGGSSLVTLLGATGLLLNLSAPHPEPLDLPLTTDRPRLHRLTAARLGQGIMLLLCSIALISGIWTVFRAGELQTYPTNPRYILAEGRIRRGQILDRGMEVLASIEIDETGYVTRTYPVPEAAPIVGFATLEYGTDGIEAACDARLRGEVDRTLMEDIRKHLLHIDPVGRDVRLTIDVNLQREAQNLLEGEIGAAVLVDARTGEILALASSPIYNPATVVEQWPFLREEPNSPFLNRATQGLAQPGSVLQPFILGTAWDDGAALTPSEPITAPVPFNGLSVSCRVAPEPEGPTATWEEALHAGCPYPFTTAAQQLNDDQLIQSLARWGFLDAPSLALPTVAADLETAALEAQAEALGQGQLLVTPLQLVRAIAALANEGTRPGLRLLTEPLGGCAETEPEPSVRVLDPDVADELLDTLPAYGDAVGHVGTSLAGPERQQAWFIGLNSASLPRYAVAVFIDRASQPERAAEIGAELLRLVVEGRQTS